MMVDVTEEGSSARLVRNTLTNGAGAVLGVGVFLVLTPFMILGLGAEAYGVFTLALSLSFLGGYAAFTDLGVETATARYVAEARSEQDSAEVDRLASTTMVFFGAAAVVLTPVICALSLAFVELFDVRADLRQQAVLCFALTGVQLLFEMPARTYFAVLEGAQRFTAYQACEVLRIVTQATMFALVLVFDLGIGALGGALAASSLCVLVLARHLAHRVVPELRISPAQADRQLLRRLLGYGGGLVGLRVIATLYRQMDRFIVGAALGPRYVTFYEIANKIQSSALLVQSIAASALVPATAFARARMEVLQDMLLRGTAYTLAASLPFAGAVLIFADPLIRTWIDPKYTSAAGPTRLFTAYLALTSIVAVATPMCIALGHLRFLLIVNSAAVAGNLAISLALVHRLGIHGVIIGTVASVVVAFPLQIRYVLRLFELPLSAFVRRALVPQLPGLLIQAATAAPLLWLAQRSSNLAEVGVLALVSIGLSVAAFAIVGLRGEHRRALLGALRGALQ